jgi:hypothetical protein
MNTIPIVLSFAALVATGLAQNPTAKPTPSQEIAPLVAVEEQEGDLKRAETLYREALAGTALSADARQLLTLRLAELLYKLGRRDEAKQVMASAGDGGGAVVTLDDVTQQQQDGERVAALRKKAAELVQKVLQQMSVPYPAATGISDSQLRSQLLWLGPAAIPEIAAALAGETRLFETAKADNQAPAALSAIMGLRRQAVAGLAGVIWELGGEAAESHLDALFAKVDAPFRRALVQFAWQAREPRMLRLAERWLQQEQDDEVAEALLAASGPLDGSAGGSPGLLQRLELATVLDTLAERSPRLQARVLEILRTSRKPSDACIARLHEFARRILSGTEPDLGRTALSFLASTVSQETPLGVEMWLEQLPGLSEGLQAMVTQTPTEWLDPAIERPDGVARERRTFVRREVAVSLWPKLVRCAREVPSTSSRAEWLRIWLHRTAYTLDDAIVPDVVDLVERGWQHSLGLLRGKVTSANAAQVFRLYEKYPVWWEVLGYLRGADLPTELFPLLAERAAAAMAKEPTANTDAWSHLIASTGHPEAVTWLMAQAKEGRLDRDALGGWLVHCGRRAQHEALRAAMREVAEQVGDPLKTRLYLALLSMHDTATLARVGDSTARAAVVKHDYAKTKDHQPISPLGYVLMDQPDPPHGFTEAELLEFVRREAALHGSGRIDGLDPTRVPTSVVTLLAEKSDMSLQWLEKTGALTATQRIASWQMEMANRIAAEADMHGPLHRWLDGAIAAKGRVLRVIESFGERDRVAFRPQFERMLAGDDLELATFAFEQLRREGGFDYESLTNSKHRTIAHDAALHGMARGSTSIAVALRHLATSPEPQKFARYLGDKVAVEAVPALLQLVQHQEPEVRQAANEALAKIRFVHEQKSYWDRITKGLDASPTSAVEKLLLQAKPGAPAEQRLLAITSLGALGMPEALPFLIEWTQDTDADIAKAAKDAITQIHLQPRR